MVLTVLLLITGLFAGGLLVRNVLIRRLCALCAGISGSWFVLLILYKLGRFHDPVLLALLMGQGVTGAFYVLQRKLSRSLRVFTLPFVLTLTVLAYWVVTGSVAVLPVLGFLFLLWAIGYVLFTAAQDKGSKVAEAVIRCCGDN